jgi:hypothetical protein
MFWKKCTSNRMMIIFGQPQAEFVQEVDLKGLAQSFKKLNTRLNTLDTSLGGKCSSLTNKIDNEDEDQDKQCLLMSKEIKRIKESNALLEEKIDKILTAVAVAE